MSKQWYGTGMNTEVQLPYGDAHPLDLVKHPHGHFVEHALFWDMKSTS